MRTVIRGTEHAIEPSDDYLCDLCEDKPTTREGIEYPETYNTPAELLAVCDECAGTR